MPIWTRREVLQAGAAAAAGAGLLPGLGCAVGRLTQTAAPLSGSSPREQLLLDFDWRFQLGNAADLHREREARYKQDRESWRARLRAYQGARQAPVTSRDGWWPLDDEDEYDEACRWPVLSDDFVRGPPATARESAIYG